MLFVGFSFASEMSIFICLFFLTLALALTESFVHLFILSFGFCFFSLCVHAFDEKSDFVPEKIKTEERTSSGHGISFWLCEFERVFDSFVIRFVRMKRFHVKLRYWNRMRKRRKKNELFWMSQPHVHIIIYPDLDDASFIVLSLPTHSTFEVLCAFLLTN